MIVGSLRKDSINLKVTNALAELAPAALKLSIIEIGHLPIYNQDADENPSAAWMPPTKPLAETEDFDKIIAVDLKGDFLYMKYEIRHMLKAGGGAIVNTASVSSVIVDPGMSPYPAAKHGVIGLTKAAAVDYATKGIRVNALAPGPVETPMTAGWMNDPAFRQVVASNSLLGRPARPEEITEIILFLCSPSASFATGGVYMMDGGQSAH